MKPKAWSFSALNSYETCPKKYYEESVAKNIPWEEGEAQAYGKAAHKHFEDRLLKGRKLPMDLMHHEKILSRLEGAAKVELMGEQKMALDKDLNPTGYFDRDVWVRGQADLILMFGTRALVVDWKFGKAKDCTQPGAFDQLELMAMLFSCYHPEVEVIEAAYYWGKEKRFDTTIIPRDSLPELWNKFLPRITLFEGAFKKDEFPAKQNGLCSKWCKVKACPFNGG